MNTIKKLKKQDSDHYLLYSINGEKYRAYELGKIPAKFGCIQWNNNAPITKENKASQGIDKWMICNELGSGHAGLVFVNDSYFPKWS